MLTLLQVDGLEVVRISDDEILLKRGVHEVLVRGAEVEGFIQVIQALRGAPATVDETVGRLPEGDHRESMRALLQDLMERQLLGEPPFDDAAAPVLAESAQRAFYRDFGAIGGAAPTRIAQARIVVFGADAIAQVLIDNLAAMGAREVTLVRPTSGSAFETPLRVPDSVLAVDAGEEQIGGATLVCATSTAGEVGELLDVSRLALAAGVPFLPVWLADLQGYVGPLNYPYETACLRCYQLRVDSNDDRYAVRRALRRYRSAPGEHRPVGAALPPMTGVLGQIASMEVAKVIGLFAPSDVVGRSIQVNLVSFRTHISRVLKVPRCPDCGEGTSVAPAVVRVGPQITDSQR